MSDSKDNKDNVIFVLDTETTGLSGHPWDYVVEIGVVKVDIDKREVTRFYNEIIGYDMSEWKENALEAWIFKSVDKCTVHEYCFGGDDGSDITHEMIQEAYEQGNTLEKIANELHEKFMEEINGSKGSKINVAAFNNGYDFDKFLLKDETWKFMDAEYYEIKDCLMLSSTSVCKIHSPYGYGYKWPTLQQARRIILGPELVRKHKIPGESHRAEDDAYISGHVLLKLYDRGFYKI